MLADHHEKFFIVIMGPYTALSIVPLIETVEFAQGCDRFSALLVAFSTKGKKGCRHHMFGRLSTRIFSENVMFGIDNLPVRKNRTLGNDRTPSRVRSHLSFQVTFAAPHGRE